MNHRILLMGTVAAGLALSSPVLAQEEPLIAFVVDAPFYVTWASANVRVAPDATSELLETLPFGAHVAVTGEVAGGDWFRVALPGGRVGYVWVDVLAPMVIAAPSSPSAPSPAPMEPIDGPTTIPITNDNDFSAATALGPLPAFVSGGVGDQDGSDYWTFTLDAWTDVVVTLSGLSSDIDIALIDPDGDFIAESIAGGSADELMEATLGPGQYYIEVYVFDGDSLYDLLVEGFPAEPPPLDSAGDTLDDAADLGVLNGLIEVTEFVGPADQGDMFRFEMPADGSVTVQLSDLESDVDVELLDDFGSTLGSSAAGGSDPEVIETDVSAGTYFVHVYPFDGASTFTLTVEAVTTPIIPEPQPEPATLPVPSGNPGTAQDPIILEGPLPLTVSRTVDGESDGDYFRLTLEQSGPVTITLTPDTADLDLEVYTADDTYLGGSFNLDTEADVVTIDPNVGDIVIRVYGFGDGSAYQLDVATAP